MYDFQYLLGPKCATGAVLPANYLTSSDSSYLPGFGPKTTAPAPSKLSWVPLAAGAVLIGGVLYFVAKGASPVLANPGLPDGVAKRKGFTARDADPMELARGTKHEMEHTRSKRIARQIALDHLAEDAHYYRKLERMEKRP